MNANDRERSEAAVREYGAAVYRLAFSQLQNIADTEDVFQEVFLRYVEKAPIFQGQEHEKAWLLRVTLNCCRDLFRSPFRRRRTALEEAENLPAWDAEETHLREQLQKLPKKGPGSAAPFLLGGYDDRANGAGAGLSARGGAAAVETGKNKAEKTAGRGGKRLCWRTHIKP